MARLSSLMCQRSWNMPSAWLRVLTNTSAVRLDERIDFAQRITRRMAGPRHALTALEHGDIGRGAGFGDDEIGQCGPAALRHHETAQIVGLRHSRRQPDAGELRRQ